MPIINAAAAPYSVACNGSTDDTIGIQKALNAAIGPAIVLMPAGQCKTTSPLYIFTNGLQWWGQGQGGASSTGTAIVSNQATGNIIQIGGPGVIDSAGVTHGAANVSDTVIQDISVSASVTRTSGAGIYRYSGAWNYMRRVNVTGTYQGYVVDGTCEPSGTGNCDYDNYVYDSRFNSNTASNIIVGVSNLTGTNTVSNGFPQNEFFFNIDTSVGGNLGTGAGMTLYSCGGCNLTGVQGIENTTGLLIYPGPNQSVGVFSDGLQMDSSFNSGLDFESSPTAAFTR